MEVQQGRKSLKPKEQWADHRGRRMLAFTGCRYEAVATGLARTHEIHTVARVFDQSLELLLIQRFPLEQRMRYPLQFLQVLREQLLDILVTVSD